ncbi:MAG: GNAT family N-acetyltransferase [Cyanobacteria bacterium J06639_16]
MAAVAMDLKFLPLDKNHALALLTWQYEPPYEGYNFSPKTIEDDLTYLLNPRNAFYAILNPDGELEGYCSFGADGQVPGGSYPPGALDIGMGIRPDLTGQKRGVQYAQAVVQYGRACYGASILRVTIAAFNQRAQRVWQKLGFEPVGTFMKRGSQDQFLIMSRDYTNSTGLRSFIC